MITEDSVNEMLPSLRDLKMLYGDAEWGLQGAWVELEKSGDWEYPTFAIYGISQMPARRYLLNDGLLDVRYWVAKYMRREIPRKKAVHMIYKRIVEYYGTEVE